MAGPKKSFYGKDGTTYHSDGTKSETIGGTTYHSDGTTSKTIGDTTYHSDGSTSRNINGTTYHSDGSTSQNINGTTYHSDGSSSQSDLGCYLTTACVVARNLPDDCEELTILRRFRDNYLRKQESGEKDIEHYYEVAPKIVQKIGESANAKERFTRLYETLVFPCVNYIKAGQYDEAYKLYKATTLKLESEF